MAAEPERADYQYDLFVSRGKLGLLALETGDAAWVVVWLEQAQAIAVHLTQLNPTNSQVTADLAWVREQYSTRAGLVLPSPCSPLARW